MSLSLVLPSFFAGLLTFLAPCTLPLVPGYLGFISGVSIRDLQDPTRVRQARRRIFLNGLLYVLGFSLIFIALGSLVGLGGVWLGPYRVWLSRIGGVFVILFGLYMMHLLELPFLRFLKSDKHLPAIRFVRPGRPASSLLFGAAFALGWTPCVGPVLGSILTVAAASGTVGQGAFLLAMFSLGLAIPFLVIAAGIGWFSKHLAKVGRYLNAVSVIGGIFLVFIGLLLLTNSFGVWIAYFFRVFDFINYDRLLNYL